MESIYDGVEDQCGRTAMTDTGRMVPAIEGDEAGRPWVEFSGDWLYRVDVPERAFALPLGDMGDIYHVQHFHIGGKLLLSPYVRRAGLIVSSP